MSIVQAVIDDLSADPLSEGDIKRVIVDLNKKENVLGFKEAAARGSLWEVYDNVLVLAVSMRAEFERRIERYKRNPGAGWQANDLAARQAYDEALKLCVTVRNIIAHAQSIGEALS